MEIKLLCMDVDGTLTDGRLYIGAEGEVAKAFDVKDGYAIGNILPSAGIMPVVITGRRSRLVERRCEELNITELHQGVSDKATCLKSIVSKIHLSLSEVAYFGDDLNDLSCMKEVAAAGGVVGCPSDACEEVKAVAHFISIRSGGRGAAREFIDWLVSNCPSIGVQS